MQPWWAFFLLTSKGSVCLAQTIPLTGNTSNPAIMLIWLYKMFYLLSFYTHTSVQKPLGYTAEHVRVGCTPVGLSWTRFNSLLTAFVYGLSHKPGSFQPSQTCSSDLSLVSNEPPRSLLKKKKKQKNGNIQFVSFHLSFPTYTDKGGLTVLKQPWCSNVASLFFTHVLSWSSTNNKSLFIFLKYIHIPLSILLLSSLSLLPPLSRSCSF